MTDSESELRRQLDVARHEFDSHRDALQAAIARNDNEGCIDHLERAIESFNKVVRILRSLAAAYGTNIEAFRQILTPTRDALGEYLAAARSQGIDWLPDILSLEA